MFLHRFAFSIFVFNWLLNNSLYFFTRSFSKVVGFLFCTFKTKMIDVTHSWVTTPVVSKICGKNFQVVFETDIISIDKKEEWKLPNDFQCNNCGSFDIEWTDFQKK